MKFILILAGIAVIDLVVQEVVGCDERGLGQFLVVAGNFNLLPVFERFFQIVSKLVDADNTVVIIEHNLDIIRSADWIIDLGPEGGKNGGEILFEGTPEELKSCSRSITARYI